MSYLLLPNKVSQNLMAQNNIDFLTVSVGQELSRRCNQVSAGAVVSSEGSTGEGFASKLAYNLVDGTVVSHKLLDVGSRFQWMAPFIVSWYP